MSMVQRKGNGAAMKENTDVRSMFDRKQIGAWDLVGKDVTVTIRAVRAEELRNRSGKDKKPIVYFEGSDLGFALNKTNMKIIAAMYGYDTRAWVGKRVTLFPTKTSFGPEQVDCIRVRPGIPKTKATKIQEQPVDEDMRAQQEAARDKAEAEEAERAFAEREASDAH